MRTLLAILFFLSGALAAETVEITVVTTGDIHGELSPRTYPWSGGDLVGGMDTLSGYLRVIEDENPGGVVAVDAGDLMQGTLVSGLTRGRPICRALALMGFAAGAVGNHEFDWGRETLRRRGFAHRFLGANVSSPSGAPFRGHAVVRRNGVRIGLIGVSHPETPVLTSPANVAGLTFSDPAGAVERELDALDAKDVDLVVVIAHLGSKGPGYGRSGELARALDPSRVHLVVGGHTHRYAATVINDIPVVEAWSGGTAFGRVDFTVDRVSGEVRASWPRVQTTWADAYYHGRRVVPDPKVANLVARFERRLATKKNRVVGRATGTLGRSRTRESPLGDWITDVLRESSPGADFAFVNSGGIRADLHAGDITFGEIYDVMPFDNTVVRVRLTGAEVRAVLEQGITGDHGVIQVSGLRFAFDYDLPTGERIIGRVIDARTNLPLEPDRVYTVAVPDFLADGGDDMTVLPAAPRDPPGNLVRDLLVRRLEEGEPVVPPDPAEELRMVSFGSP